jgi:putative ABC transport system permease protein
MAINDDLQLGLSAMPERQYYANQTSAGAPLVAGIFVAIIMAAGSSFAAMNTMYAAVARRSKEMLPREKPKTRTVF